VTAGQLQRGVVAITARLAREGLITDEGQEVLRGVAAQLQPGRGRSWGYSIPRDKPLRFSTTPEMRSAHRLDVDVFCRIAGHGQDKPDPLTAQEIVVRVWTSEKELFYREMWDATRLLELFGDGTGARRVMIRYRFDRAREGAAELRYHTQFGGMADDDELCWHPEKLDVPRIMHPPIDLVLACESVVANFFPKTHAELCRDPEWSALIKSSERLYIGPYLDECRAAVRKQTTLCQQLRGM
jgi:hypothetical protein